MGEEQPKSWWGTIPGVLTAIAALITAVAGLIVALKQTSRMEAQTASAIPEKPAISAPVAPRPSASAAVKSRHPAAQAKNTPVDSVPAAIDRPSYAVTLPTPREYSLGLGILIARYTLLAANLAPQTPESDALTLRIGVKSRTEYPVDLSSDSFSLVVNSGRVKPETLFTDRVPVHESREEDVVFVIPPRLSRAVLRIDVYGGNAQIPLDLTPPNSAH